MAHVLRITDGTNTVTFTTGDMYLAEFIPQVSLKNEPMYETLTVGFTNTITTIRSNVQSINRLLARAALYMKSETGPRVYVEFDPGNTGDVYRSMLYGGYVGLTADSLGGQWGAANLELELEWIRDPFWEGPLTQLTLSNSSATDNTSGITVNNVNDTTGENWVAIDDTELLGDLPAPIKVNMVNAYTSAAACDEIFIFHNVFSTPGSLTHILEGEDAGGAGITPTAESGNGASNDQYAAIDWTATTETKIATWPISTTELSYMKGGRFMVLARWYGAFPYSDCWLRLKLEGASGVLWEGSLSLIPDTRELHTLGTVRLPPYLYGQSDLKGISLTLYALRNASGTHTINLDYLMLSPVSEETGWKRFVSLDAGVAYQEEFFHDATEYFDYRQDTAGDAIAEFVSYGGPLLLIPNEDQRVYFVTCDTNGAALVEQDWTVQMWYRPRRSSV